MLDIKVSEMFNIIEDPFTNQDPTLYTNQDIVKPFCSVSACFFLAALTSVGIPSSSGIQVLAPWTVDMRCDWLGNSDRTPPNKGTHMKTTWNHKTGIVKTQAADYLEELVLPSREDMATNAAPAAWHAHPRQPGPSLPGKPPCSPSWPCWMGANLGPSSVTSSLERSGSCPGAAVPTSTSTGWDSSDVLLEACRELQETA